MKRASIDLNADVGEGCGFDAELIPLVSSVNIACGAHAGDRDTMRSAVALAQAHGVAIGAHPGFADRENFGRKEIPINPAAAAALVVSQVRLLADIAAESGATVGHVKLHGALYNMAARDSKLSKSICAALADENRASSQARYLVTLAGSVMASDGPRLGLRVVGEAFADRAYLPDATLMPRTQKGAVLDVVAASTQAITIAGSGEAFASDGSAVTIDAASICIHGDGRESVTLARRVRAALDAGNIRIESYLTTSAL